MGRKLAGVVLVLLGLIPLVAACGGDSPRAATPTSLPAADKYVFVERWIDVYEGPLAAAFIDFPTYSFNRDTGELTPYIVPPGNWFPLEDLTALKVAYGRGTGSKTGGIESKVFAITGFPFVEPAKEDTDVLVTVEGIDADGVAYLKRGDQQIVLQPGQEWTRDVKSTVDWGGVKSDVSARERITNYGLQDKARIQLVSQPR